MTLSRKSQEPSNSTAIHQKLDTGRFVIRRSRNAVCDWVWRVRETPVRGLRRLWREGWRVYFVDMAHSTLIGHGGDPTVEGGSVDAVRRLWPKNGLPCLFGWTRTRDQEHSSQPTHAKMQRPSHERRDPEQIRSSTIAARDINHPKNDRDTGLRVAIAHRHPRITHARATSCPVCTCAHHRWC